LIFSGRQPLKKLIPRPALVLKATSMAKSCGSSFFLAPGAGLCPVSPYYYSANFILMR
jgi:hypothetical protein